jgi:hypothetical protein
MPQRYEPVPDELIDSRTVIHAIAGLGHAHSFMAAKKLLILGYKNYGRGILQNAEQQIKIEQNLERWRYFLPAFLNRKGCVTSFDNIALDQLRVKEAVEWITWQRRFMGNDGTFSFYVDAVKMEYAKNSTSPRRPLRDMTIMDAWKELQNELDQKHAHHAR